MNRILAILLLTSCSSYDPREGESIDPEFIPYVQAFELECHCVIKDIPITFTKLKYAVAGECDDYASLTAGYQEIRINQRSWDGFPTDRREMLLFHELGHCILHRKHSLAQHGGIPTSLMYPYIDVIPIYYYQLHRRQYLAELFARENDEND